MIHLDLNLKLVDISFYGDRYTESIQVQYSKGDVEYPNWRYWMPYAFLYDVLDAENRAILLEFVREQKEKYHVKLVDEKRQ